MNNQHLLPLLDHLASTGPNTGGWWQGWRIRRIDGGANNLLYRATGAGDFAVKWTMRDTRDRAGREYAALNTLHEAGLAIAPLPVLIDRDRYAQPVVVQTWLVGDVMTAPPDTEEEWWALVRHFAAIHTISPDRTNALLSPAVLSMHNPWTGRERIREQLACLPPSARSPVCEELMRLVEMTAFPVWSSPKLTLCRCDPTTLNLIRRPGTWASVDWENSGWGDPAFEIADIMAHPAYMNVSINRWEWMIAAYCGLRADASLAIRIRVYHTLLLVWWVVRLDRALYEVPLGRDQRLAERSVIWQAETQAKYEHYVRVAQAAVAGRV